MGPIVVQAIEHGSDLFVEPWKFLYKKRPVTADPSFPVRTLKQCCADLPGRGNYGQMPHLHGCLDCAKTKLIDSWVDLPCTQTSTQSQWNHTASSEVHPPCSCPSWAEKRFKGYVFSFRYYFYHNATFLKAKLIFTNLQWVVGLAQSSPGLPAPRTQLPPWEPPLDRVWLG